MSEKKQETVKLDEKNALLFALHDSRAKEAETLLALRRAESQAFISKLREQYSEGGKYEVTALDVTKLEVVRELRTFRVEPSAAESSSTEGAQS